MATIVSTKTAQFRFGWAPDLPDHRDHTYAAPHAKLTAAAPLPTKVDLRKNCPPIYNQGNIGSCSANAIAAALEFDRIKQKLADCVDCWLQSNAFRREFGKTAWTRDRSDPNQAKLLFERRIFRELARTATRFGSAASHLGYAQCSNFRLFV